MEEGHYEKGDDLVASDEKSLEHSTRLRHLLDITKLLASLEEVRSTVGAVFEGFSQALDLQTAVLVLPDSEPIVWNEHGDGQVRMERALRRARDSYAYLTGNSSESQVSEGLEFVREGQSELVALPLVVKHREVLGLMQLEGRGFDEGDLLFMSAAVTQLALALDRETHIREWQATNEAARVEAEHARKIAEAARAEAEQAKHFRDNVLALVSHDLKNPLSGILISTEMLLTSPSLSPSGRRQAETAHEAAQRMNRLIADLLDWASINAGKLAVVMDSVPVKVLLDDALAQLGPMAQEKPVVLEIEHPICDERVSCDRDRILQVFSNLIGNALKFSPTGSRVLLGTRRMLRRVVFSVTDEGPGIPSTVHKKIFERMWTTEDASRSGTGLGLAIAKGILDSHDGRIWVESVPGKGSTFFFTLPLAAAE